MLNLIRTKIHRMTKVLVVLFLPFKAEWRSEIAIIKDGAVNSYLRNPDLEKYMPILPANLETVNLKWKAGDVRVSTHMLISQSLSLFVCQFF